MNGRPKSVRVYPIALRGVGKEGYAFLCDQTDRCSGKAVGQPLPEGCRLLGSAKAVSPLNREEVEKRLVEAECLGEHIYD